MQEIKELSANELDAVSGGIHTAAGGGSNGVSDFLKWLLNQLHIPASSGGPIQK